MSNARLMIVFLCPQPSKGSTSFHIRTRRHQRTGNCCCDGDWVKIQLIHSNKGIQSECSICQITIYQLFAGNLLLNYRVNSVWFVCNFVWLACDFRVNGVWIPCDFFWVPRIHRLFFHGLFFFSRHSRGCAFFSAAFMRPLRFVTPIWLRLKRFYRLDISIPDLFFQDFILFVLWR